VDQPSIFWRSLAAESHQFEIDFGGAGRLAGNGHGLFNSDRLRS
jgi:hypothetical protein